MKYIKINKLFKVVFICIVLLASSIVDENVYANEDTFFPMVTSITNVEAKGTANSYTLVCDVDGVGEASIDWSVSASWYTSLTESQKQNIYIEVPATAITIKTSMAAINKTQGDYRIIDIDMSNADNLEVIKTKAFYNNQKIVGKIIFPTNKKLKTVEASAFENAVNISGDLHLPNTIESIGASAFSNVAFTGGTLQLPENPGYTKIEDYTFLMTSLQGELKIPGNVIEIGKYAFSNEKILPANLPERNHKNEFTKVSWHDNLKIIGAYAFPRVDDTFIDETGIVQDYILPSNLEVLEKGCLWNLVPKNSSVKIPASVQVIGDMVFVTNNRAATIETNFNNVKMPHLKTIIIENPNPEWSKVGYSTSFYYNDGALNNSDTVVIYTHQTAFDAAKGTPGIGGSRRAFEVSLELKDINGNVVNQHPALLEQTLGIQKYTNDRGHDYWSRIDKNGLLDTYKLPAVNTIEPLQKGFQRVWLHGSKAGELTNVLVNENIGFNVKKYDVLKESVLQQQDVLERVVWEKEWLKEDHVYILPVGTKLILDPSEESIFNHTLANEENTREVGDVYFEYRWIMVNESATNWVDSVPSSMLNSNNQLVFQGEKSENLDISGGYAPQYYILQYDAFYMSEKGPYKFETTTPKNTMGVGFYVHFTEDEIKTITFDRQDNSANPIYTQGAVQSLNFEGNASVNSIFFKTPSRQYYRFVSWNTLPDGLGSNYTRTTPITADTNLYAQWKFIGNYYNITSTIKNGNGAINNQGTKGDNKQGEDYIVELSPNSDYRIKTLLVNGKDVTDEIIDNTFKIMDLQQDYTIEVEYESIPTYTISFDGQGGDTPASIQLETGSVYGVLPEPKRSEYTFNGWYTNVLDNASKVEETTIFTATSNQVLYAKWTINSYEVTFDSKGGDSLTKQTIDHGSKVENPGDPTRNNYAFDGWYSDAAYANAWDFVNDEVTSAMTLYAKWTADTYTITYSINGGTNHPTNKTSYTVETATFTLGAPSWSGHVFTGWTWDGETNPTKNVTIVKGSTGNLSYTANWDLNDYVVSFNSQSGSIVGNVQAKHGIAIAKPTDPMRMDMDSKDGIKRQSVLTNGTLAMV